MTHTFFLLPFFQPPSSPYPRPWTWRGGFASGQTAQDGPRWLQEGLRALKMASKIAQDLKIARHGSANSQHAPKRPQHRPTGIWGYGPTTRRQPRRRGAPGRPRGGWGEILSSDRVNVSRKLGGERSYPRTSNGSYVTRSRASGLSGEAEGFLEGGKPEAQGKAMRTSLIASTLNLFPHHRPSGLRPSSSPSWPHPQPPSDDGPDALAQLSIYGSTD